MPVFISYSHKDKYFVDQFAAQLVQHKVHVWLDRWELQVGDSIIDKIQSALEGSSALIVILSQSSVLSEWCKKELSGGLLKELEEKKVVVLPVLIEDCKIPLFLRGKLFADFRNSYDEGFSTVLEAIAKVTSNTLGRTDEPEYHVDWSIDWGKIRDKQTLTLTMVEQALDQPYTVLNEIFILFDEKAEKNYLKLVSKGRREYANYRIISCLKNFVSDQKDVRIILEDARPREFSHIFIDPKIKATYQFSVTTRRLGQDTGRDILFNLGDQVALIKNQLFEVNKPDSNDWEF